MGGSHPEPRHHPGLHRAHLNAVMSIRIRPRLPPPHTSAVTSRLERRLRTMLRRIPPHTSFRRRKRRTGGKRNSPESRPIDARYSGVCSLLYGGVSSGTDRVFCGTTERRFIGLDSGELRFPPVQCLRRRNDVWGGLRRNRFRSRHSLAPTLPLTCGIRSDVAGQRVMFTQTCDAPPSNPRHQPSGRVLLNRLFAAI